MRSANKGLQKARGPRPSLGPGPFMGGPGHGPNFRPGGPARRRPLKKTTKIKSIKKKYTLFLYIYN